MKGCAVTGWGGDAETEGKRDPLIITVPQRDMCETVSV